LHISRSGSYMWILEIDNEESGIDLLIRVLCLILMSTTHIPLINVSWPVRYFQCSHDAYIRTACHTNKHLTAIDCAISCSHDKLCDIVRAMNLIIKLLFLLTYVSMLQIVTSFRNCLGRKQQRSSESNN